MRDVWCMAGTSDHLTRLSAEPHSRLARPAYWLYEQNLLLQLQWAPNPKHIDVIMDGNRRFARRSEVDIKAGHDFGAARPRLPTCTPSGQCDFLRALRSYQARMRRNGRQ